MIQFRLVDRFRYDEPQARPERDSVNSDFWWLHGIILVYKSFHLSRFFFPNIDELKTTCDTAIDDDDDDERKSNIPEFIEVTSSCCFFE